MQTPFATKTRYTLNELLAQCDPSAPIPEDMKEWLSARPVGKEEYPDIVKIDEHSHKRN
jgi:hypothetical protein